MYKVIVQILTFLISFLLFSRYHPLSSYFILSITRSLALLALGLFSNSSSLGLIALFTTKLKSGKYSSGMFGIPFRRSSIAHFSLKKFFTSLSSNEWNVITATLPPTFRSDNACSKAGSITSSSLFFLNL